MDEAHKVNEINALIETFLPGHSIVYTRVINSAGDTTTITFAAPGGAVQQWELEDVDEALSVLSGIEIGITIGRHGT
jgi:hypothetical protein